jgi:tRNA pseudouridine38-40 synthase
MTRFAAGVEYRGARYSGWQRQRHTAGSIQEHIETALSRVADEPIAVVTAGRTDAGVHATGQVLHFDSARSRSERAWQWGANRYLPGDIALHWVKRVDQAFHARYSALSRSYRYVLFNRPVRTAVFAGLATHEYRPLDVGRMSAAAQSLVGTHDFSAFRASDCQARTALRTVTELSIQRAGEWVWLDIRANAFLQHMVRNIVGTLLEIGSGARPEEWAHEVLQRGDRRIAGAAAPAAGLYLAEVRYAGHWGVPPAPARCRFW